MSAYRWVHLHPAVATLRVALHLLKNEHLIPGMNIPEVMPHISPILQNAKAAADADGALKFAVGSLFRCVRNACAFVQQLHCNHSLLVYPVKGCQVVWGEKCLHGGVAVGAVDTMCLPVLLARISNE
jgi:hypothetical protein